MPVAMMVATHVLLKPQYALLLQNLLDRPPKAVTAILIYSLNHQQSTANLKYRCANKRTDTACIRYFAAELCGRVLEWQPDEEGIDTPDNGSEGEYYRDKVADVPDRVMSNHAANSSKDCSGRRGRGRSNILGIGGSIWAEDYGVPSCFFLVSLCIIRPDEHIPFRLSLDLHLR